MTTPTPTTTERVLAQPPTPAEMRLLAHKIAERPEAGLSDLLPTINAWLTLCAALAPASAA